MILRKLWQLELKDVIQLMTVMFLTLLISLKDTGDAYIVPHGGHFHYIPKSDLSAGELAAAKAYLSGNSSALSQPLSLTPNNGVSAADDGLCL